MGMHFRALLLRSRLVGIMRRGSALISVLISALMPALISALILVPGPAVSFGAEPAGTCAYATREGEFGSHPECLTLNKQGQLVLAPSLAKRLSFGAEGLASVYSSRLGWMYVNRKGKIVIRGVATMDNGADYFSDGLVRFAQNGKWGYANARGRVVVVPAYDGALPFDNGIGRVCQGCKSTCAEASCEHHVLAGGEWACLNTRGEKSACPP